jgi:hypothetical protein
MKFYEIRLFNLGINKETMTVISVGLRDAKKLFLDDERRLIDVRV